MTNPTSRPIKTSDAKVDKTHGVDTADTHENLLTPVVVFVGLPGSNTSDVAQCVGQNLGLDVRNAEDHMDQLAGKPASDVLIQDGEDTYREIELAASTWACSHAGVAVVGPGMLDREDFWDGGTLSLVVGLDVEVKAALKNLGLGVAASPVINPRATWMRQADDRRQKLQQHCHHVMDVTNTDVHDTAANVVTLIR